MSNTLFPRFIRVAALLTGIYGCLLYEQPCRTDYHFNFQVELFPALDTIDVGDTVYLKIDIPAEMTDTETGQTEQVSEADFDIHAGISTYDSNHYYLMDGYFDYVNVVGEVAFTGSRISARFRQNDDGSRSLWFGFIPKYKGVYSIHCFDLFESRGNSPTIGKKCTEFYYLTYEMNRGNLDSNNYYLLKHIPPEVFATYEQFYFSGFYAFYVR